MSSSDLFAGNEPPKAELDAHAPLAERLRPRSLDEVVGQEVIARTVKNSISRGRVANAYIFCGPRGVGKTSVARLIAKTLNCEKPSGDGPCNNAGDPPCTHGICFWPSAGQTYCTQLCVIAGDCPVGMNCTPGNLSMGSLGSFPNTYTCTYP